jgi:hypothetical protein
MRAIQLTIGMLALSITLFGAGAARAADTPQAGIVGIWKGTSICTKVAGNESCNDETVVYEFTPSGNTPGAVTLNADKIVNGQPVPMYTIDMTWDAAQKQWVYEFQTRVKGRWAYRVAGKSLTGTLVILPGAWVARQVNATKSD